MEFTAMAILLGILVVVLVGGFALAWGRDKSRSEDVAEDAGRLDTDPSSRTRGH